MCYAVSRAFIVHDWYRTVSVRPFVRKGEPHPPKKTSIRHIMLMPSPRLAWALPAISPFETANLIALLNALIIHNAAIFVGRRESSQR
jgi:hypothetical protein